MKLKDSYFYTIREDVKDEDSISSKLLVRSGMIKKSSNGIYMFMPLGYKVLTKIENIIREEMNKIDAKEMLMPSLILEDIYAKSNRIDAFGNDIFKLKDRYKRNYVLGPTHEELFVLAGMMNGKSYKNFPFSLYQFQNKFRDEPRPRYGLVRTREFIMKDAYSFDKDLEGLNKSYSLMFNAYHNIFKKLNIDYKVVKADTGTMGGLLSEEFQAISDAGEDKLVFCEACDFASNIDIAECYDQKRENNDKELPLKEIHTPKLKTVKEVSSFLKVKSSDLVKTLIYKVNNQLYACLIRGDKEINELKLAKLLEVKTVELVDYQTIKLITNSEVGFAGPIGLNIPIVIDNEIKYLKNFVIGANKTDHHYLNANLKRDFSYDLVGDIKNITKDNVCPKCLNKLIFKKGLEVGNTFKLGTDYSQVFGFNYLDENNTLKPVVMGSYGIGLGRCLAAIVEQNNDDNGIIWPTCVAPYQIGIVIADINNQEQMTFAHELYLTLKEKGYEPLLDDREERIGVKFNDLDLIGIPYKIIIGKKLNENEVELKIRKTNETIIIKKDEIIDTLRFLNNKKDI